MIISNNNNMKKEKKEPGTPCKVQHHVLCTIKKQNSQVQFDESPRSGNSINRLITEPSQLPRNTMP